MIDPQRIPAEATAVCDDNAVRAARRNRYITFDAVVAVEDVRRIGLVECNDARVVNNGPSSADEAWARGKDRRKVTERKSVILLTLGHEQVLKLLQFVWVLALDVGVLGPVIICGDVVEMPFLRLPNVLDRLVHEQ